MGFIVKNVNTSVSISLTALKLVGFWAPQGLSDTQMLLYRIYSTFSFMFLLGIYILIQVVDLFIIWGDLAMMTATAFVLFTNLAQAVKIVNLMVKRKSILRIILECDEELRSVRSKEEKRIIKSCNREMLTLQLVFFLLTTTTMLGWASSAEKNQLPLRAWYPYDTHSSPAYELTYCHQIGALFVAAYLNVSKDTLVAALVAQCRCRLRLIGPVLGKLSGLRFGEQLTSAQEQQVRAKLRSACERHQAALSTVLRLQACFSTPTFLQFFVSLIIICVTAFQMVSQSGNLIRLTAMGCYLINMMFQVFIYCYQGHHLADESTEVANSAYATPWYVFPTSLRRMIIIMMIRTRRVASIKAAGFTTLSLSSFMAIIKASYSLFTLLKQVDEKI